MDKNSAINLIQDTFQNSFKEERYFNFVNNLLNHICMEFILSKVEGQRPVPVQ